MKTVTILFLMLIIEKSGIRWCAVCVLVNLYSLNSCSCNQQVLSPELLLELPRFEMM